MQALSANPVFSALTRGEKLFIESWFIATHPRSLDSFRVRCHNGRTILQELKREMGFPFANAEDLAHIAAEAQEVCSADPVLRQLLAPSWTPLETHLAALAKANKDESEKARIQLRNILTDTLEQVSANYLQRTSAALRAAIAANDDKLIIQLTNCLTTDLAARGWALSSLHAFGATKFLADNPSGTPFTHTFAGFAARISQPAEAFEVILACSGSAVLHQLGNFSDFRFSAVAPTVPEKEEDPKRRLEKFLRTNRYRTFATTTVQAVDYNSAIHEADEKMAKCLDRLRFNFYKWPVKISPEALVIRVSDRRHRLVNRVAPIPNPEHHVPLEEFLAMDARLNTLFASQQLANESRRRIEAAARHYRLGLDSQAYRDMVLNWWMGLEILTNAGDGKGIGEKVIRGALPVIVHRYFKVQLRNVAKLIHTALGNSWPGEAQTLLTVSADTVLTWQQALTVLQDTTAKNASNTLLADRPALQIRWMRFAELSNDAAKLLSYLDEHEQRVRWHLWRLYRIRCCLVHGTPVEMPLQLPAANLEYYLRECIYVVLGAFLRATQIPTLETLFDRASAAASRRKATLADKSAKADAITAALNTDFVFRVA